MQHNEMMMLTLAEEDFSTDGDGGLGSLVLLF
jgi:hypothetical protein